MGILIMKVRRSWSNIIIIMGITIVVRRYNDIETAPRFYHWLYSKAVQGTIKKQ